MYCVIKYNKAVLCMAVCLALVAGIVQCTDPESDDDENDLFIVAGYYIVSRPYKGQSIRYSDVDTIRWTSTQSPASYVSLYLCSDTSVIKTITSTALNNGYYVWSPFNFGVGTLADCRVKIASYTAPDKFDYSGLFRIYSDFVGTISVLSPPKDTIWNSGTTYTIRWSSTGNIGNYVKIELYNDTTFISTISSQESNNGSLSWYCNPAVSGSKYRIKISCYYDPGIFGLSDYFTITKGYWGTIAVTMPTDTSNWSAGNNYSVSWTYTGNIGSYVQLGLYMDTTLTLTISSMASSSGPYTWNIPGYLVTGDDYRVKVSCYYDLAICGFSDTFSINGCIPDLYERDNTRDSASTFDTLGAEQLRSLTLNDTDWVSFQATAGKYYVAQTTGTAVTYVYLYYKNGQAYINSSYGSTSTRKTVLGFSCDSSGTYYLLIRPYNTTYGYGNYMLKITEIDPFTAVTFSAPVSTSTWSAGTSYNIQWQADTSLFGQTIRLSLCIDTALVYTITTGAVNNGTYAWLVPSYMSTGNSYRIRIQNYAYPGITGYSDKFSISGLNPDAYEYDDIRDSASSFDTLGHNQQRSLTFNDTDWVSFSATSGKSYALQTAGSAVTYAYLYFKNNLNYLTYASGSTATRRTTLLFNCDTTGTYYLRVSAYSSSYYGTYILKISEIDPYTSVIFNAPIGSTTWSAGSSYAIVWQPDTILFDRYVSLALCKDTTQLLSIYSSTANNGTYTWAIPAVLASGSEYRVRMASASYPVIRGFSMKFTISGTATDTFEIDNTAGLAKPIPVDGTIQNHTLTMSDTDWVSFPGKKGMLYLVNTTAGFNHRSYLYFKNTTTYVDYQTLSVNNLNNIAVDTGTYYVCICQSSTTLGGSYTMAVREYDPNTVINFTNPTGSSTWSCGSSYSIQWTPDTAYLSTSVRIYLFADTSLLLTVITSTPNDGDHPWVVTTGLESGSIYRIKMVNYSDADLYGYSQAFSISGIPPDTFESDDTASLAHPANIGGIESHTMPYLDSDWYSLNATKSRLFVLETLDSLDTRMNLYSANLASVLATDDNSGTNNNAKITWICPATAAYYFKVWSSYTGSYRIQVTSFDSTAYKYTVSAPAQGSSFAINGVCQISWSTNISLGGTVDIFLYNTAGVVSTIEANSADDGTHSWTIPSTVTPAADYRIKIANRNYSDAYGFSGVFTITTKR